MAAAPAPPAPASRRAEHGTSTGTADGCLEQALRHEIALARPAQTPTNAAYAARRRRLRQQLHWKAAHASDATRRSNKPRLERRRAQPRQRRPSTRRIAPLTRPPRPHCLPSLRHGRGQANGLPRRLAGHAEHGQRRRIGHLRTSRDGRPSHDRAVMSRHHIFTAYGRRTSIAWPGKRLHPLHRRRRFCQNKDDNGR